MAHLRCAPEGVWVIRASTPVLCISFLAPTSSTHQISIFKLRIRFFFLLELSVIDYYLKPAFESSSDTSPVRAFSNKRGGEPCCEDVMHREILGWGADTARPSQSRRQKDYCFHQGVCRPRMHRYLANDVQVHYRT
ncbi:hypothetical protein DFH94DRAFT_300878 [Russula ochroleuca]|uniref:Uncharacterized protein n=1 Tax=Russula ochroleuca TaxID=152965 RepID=A0A9P5JWU2_9AGAM|nr:hypothetical protein DFH94DRAFT_300878 [Russula ochroleuca]